MRTSLNTVNQTGRSEDVPVEIVAVSGGVFNALGVALVEGRTFSEADSAGTSPVVILSKVAVKKFFPDRQAVGGELAVFSGNGQPSSRVVGVVDDVKFGGMEAPSAAAIYVPSAQRRFRIQYLVVRAATPTDATVAFIRQVVRRVDGTMATSDIRTVSQLTAAAIARPRFQTALLALFAISALLLAGTGLYGVVTQSVSERRREFAVRLTLGAASNRRHGDGHAARRPLGSAGRGSRCDVGPGSVSDPGCLPLWRGTARPMVFRASPWHRDCHSGDRRGWTGSSYLSASARTYVAIDLIE
jgi:ABC-type antimicrobial peptide transport system permease subunit